MASEAQKRAIKNYEKYNIDKMTLRLPKGKKEEIAKATINTGESVNGFIVSAVDEKLERIKKD